MTRIRAVIMLAVFVIGLMPGVSAAGTRECGLGGSRAENKALTTCAVNLPGLHVSKAMAHAVESCESGYYRWANKGTSSQYKGLFQINQAEFKAFGHQGPPWMDREFHKYDYGIYSARGNTLAALAHAHDYGWGSWECPV